MVIACCCGQEAERRKRRADAAAAEAEAERKRVEAAAQVGDLHLPGSGTVLARVTLHFYRGHLRTRLVPRVYLCAALCRYLHVGQAGRQQAAADSEAAAKAVRSS